MRQHAAELKKVEGGRNLLICRVFKKCLRNQENLTRRRRRSSSRDFFLAKRRSVPHICTGIMHHSDRRVRRHGASAPDPKRFPEGHIHEEDKKKNPNTNLD